MGRNTVTSLSWKRIWGVMLRHLYNFNHSLDRWCDAFYWPFFDLIVWGLAFTAIGGAEASPRIAMILSGVVLWYVLWRGQYEISLNLLEEFWDNNLVNLLGSPLKLSEWIISLFLLSILKLGMTFFFTSVMAYILYSVNILQFSWALPLFMTSLLVTGWVLGLCIGGLFLRFGTNIQSIGWAGAYIVMPFSATFYPIETLPSWAQSVAAFFPSSYIFEAMRSYLSEGIVQTQSIIISFLLNGLYFALGLLFFIASFNRTKDKGASHLM